MTADIVKQIRKRTRRRFTDGMTATHSALSSNSSGMSSGMVRISLNILEQTPSRFFVIIATAITKGRWKQQNTHLSQNELESSYILGL